MEIIAKLKESDIKKIKKSVEGEFPDDPALQQVHIARRILAREAELEGLNFLEYIKLFRKQVRNVQ